MKESTTTVAVRIPATTYAALVNMAEDTGKRRSDVLREIICAFLTPDDLTTHDKDGQ